MKVIVTAFLVIVLLVGCDAVEDMKGMFEKQELIQTSIKNRYGWDAQVGWNMHNGVLTQVSVTFDAEQVREEKVSTLERAALDAEARSFKSTPRAVFIQIAAQPSDET